jgi:hypothetical protein
MRLVSRSGFLYMQSDDINDRRGGSLRVRIRDYFPVVGGGVCSTKQKKRGHWLDLPVWNLGLRSDCDLWLSVQQFQFFPYYTYPEADPAK